QVVDLILIDHAADDDDLRVLELRLLADRLTDDVAVDVGEHVVEDDQVGAELLREHAGVVTGIGRLYLKSAIPFQHVHKQFHNLRIVIHNQDFSLAGIQRIRGNSVVLHKGNQRLAGNSPKAASWNAKALQSPAVEAANDGLLRDFADFRGFTGCENGLHKLLVPWLG